MEQETTQKEWYDNKVFLIILFFIFPPLGIYGMIKKDTNTWKKVVYILPSSLILLYFTIGIVAAMFLSKYDMGINFYKDNNYNDAYKYLKQVKPSDENYEDAVAKIKIIKPIIENLALKKQMNETAQKRENEIKKNPSLLFPQEQQDFISVINKMKEEYDSAENELKKSVIRTKRGKLIADALNNSHQINNWSGIVKTLKTTSNGKAIFAIVIQGTEIELGTVNNEFSDLFGDKTLIDQNNPLYNTISDLNEGEKIRFSGKFLKSNETDFAMEMSLTENGSMKNPEFIVQFNKVEK